MKGKANLPERRRQPAQAPKKRVRNQYEQAINASLEPDLTVNPEPGERSTPFRLSMEYSPASSRPRLRRLTKPIFLFAHGTYCFSSLSNINFGEDYFLLSIAYEMEYFLSYAYSSKVSPSVFIEH